MRCVSKSYDEQLQLEETVESRAKLQRFLFPEVVRQVLDADNSDRGAQKYNKHMNKRAPSVLIEHDVRTYAATCSHVGAEPPVLKGRPWKLILVDGAGQATEPMVAQVLTAAAAPTLVCQIGDHKQLPATVSHPANRAGNSQASMFAADPSKLDELDVAVAVICGVDKVQGLEKDIIMSR